VGNGTDERDKTKNKSVVCTTANGWLACMDYQFRGWGSNPVREEHCAPSTPLSEINYNEYTDQTLSVGDKTARKRTGHTST